MVDYTVALLIFPNILVGADIGVLLNATLPDFVVMILFMIFICMILPKMINKAIAEYRLENKMKQIKDDKLLKNGKEYAKID